MIEVTVHKLDHAGREVTRYPGEVLTWRDGALALRTEWTRAPLDLGYVTLEPNDRWTEYFYAGRWYNIFEIRTGEGQLKGWYCNVTRPPCITAEEVSWEDLALDLWVDPRREIQVLDEDEFATLSLSTDEREAALRALRELRTMVTAGEAPFDTAARSDRAGGG